MCPSTDDASDPTPDQAVAPTVPREREPGSGTSTLKRKREVSTDEAEIWAKEEGLLFVEASAKSGVNVEAAFERATRDILEKIRRGVFDDDRVRTRFDSVD